MAVEGYSSALQQEMHSLTVDSYACSMRPVTGRSELHYSRLSYAVLTCQDCPSCSHFMKTLSFPLFSICTILGVMKETSLPSSISSIAAFFRASKKPSPSMGGSTLTLHGSVGSASKPSGGSTSNSETCNRIRNLLAIIPCQSIPASGEKKYYGGLKHFWKQCIDLIDHGTGLAVLVECRGVCEGSMVPI